MRHAPVLVVGAGLAGLSCALQLQEAGRPVQILEASDGVGGRVRSDRIGDCTVDRGFQILLTAFPEVRRLGLDLLPQGQFTPGALVRRQGWWPLEDPARRPEALLANLRGPGSIKEKIGVLALRQRLMTGQAEALLEGEDRSVASVLDDLGLTGELRDGFLRPWFGGILLDEDLSASWRMFAYYFRMLATGHAALPHGGIGTLSTTLAARLAPGTIRLNTRVVAVEGSSVVLDDGSRVAGSAVVVATEAPAAHRLLGEKLPPPARGKTVRSLWFTFAGEPPARGDMLILNGDHSGPALHLAFPSAVAQGYAPAGSSVAVATVLGDGPDPEAEVRQQLHTWFGSTVESWRLLVSQRIIHAQPRQDPGDQPRGERTTLLATGLAVCGDHRAQGSLQGALASGRRAALALLS